MKKNARRAAAAALCLATGVAAAQSLVLGQADVVGVKLGMTPADALAKLKAYDPPLEIKTQQLAPQAGVAPYAHAYQATWQSSTDQGQERISVGITMPPDAQRVWAVQRSVNFADGKQPERDQLLAALRKKYGPEMYLRKDQSYPVLQWAHDAEGRPLPETVIRQCGGWFSDLRIGSYDQMYRPPGGGATSRQLIPCYTADYVSIALLPSSRNPGLVGQMSQHIESGALLGEAMAHTREWLAQQKAAGAQQELQHARQQAQPKL